MGIMNCGSSGVNGTGLACGNPLSSLILLQMMGAPQNVRDHIVRWFENTYLPTNQAYEDFRSGTWTAAGAGFSGSNSPLNNAPKVKPETMTCHGAHTRWKAAAGSWIAVHGADRANHDRCRKSTYATVHHLVEIINTWKAGGAVSGALDPGIATCRTPACHGGTYPTGGASGKMKCAPCHSSLAAVVPGHGM